jgi:hypothetical protein
VELIPCGFVTNLLHVPFEILHFTHLTGNGRAWHARCQTTATEAEMKKVIATLVTLIVVSMAALPVAAQTRTRCANRSTYNGRTTYNTSYNRDARYRDNTYRQSVYQNDSYYADDYYGRDRSVWQEHRDKITTAGGAVGGAILGGLIGGKKGAVIGAITGGAGAAIYTYKIRDKNRRY